MNLATRSHILLAEKGDKVSPDEEDSEELGLPPERCEAAASASCLLSSVKVSGCNTRPLCHPAIPQATGVFVLAVWTGSSRSDYSLNQGDTHTHTLAV